MSIIEVNNLSKTFTYYEKKAGLRHSWRHLFHREELERHAVSQISFNIEQGEAVAFIGPNGAGKTTTLKMLTGILHPTSGHASVLGYTPWERAKAFKRNFAIVMGQKSQLWWDLPANESIYLNKCIYDIEDRIYQDTLDELAEMLDVTRLLGVQVRRLSLGERMKMEIIAALIHQPKLLFLDEPTLGLDYASQKKVRQFLRSYNEQKQATIILTSHYMKDIQDVCSRAIVIAGGKIAFDGRIDAMKKAFGDYKRVKVRFYEPWKEEEVYQWLGAHAVVHAHHGDTLDLQVEHEAIKTVSRLLIEHSGVEDWSIEEEPIEESIERIYVQQSKERGLNVGQEQSRAAELQSLEA
ncbi:ABC transporter ATP-binding protein [Paenibacillus aquistagni]|uniref:ABC transporter ATP-binding protein n=1 Tax=Paenibacillus aquistagni TaxID=1852522 RepID=UPI000B50369C|nr:ATP-binding cassette domain-containing protein [Paenibacillus aquistagni]NMM50962.1 ATP-binding cassette domain-containing protein [Paenibacillus aquistagni]